jgi:hypothetical protein
VSPTQISVIYTARSLLDTPCSKGSRVHGLNFIGSLTVHGFNGWAHIYTTPHPGQSDAPHALHPIFFPFSRGLTATPAQDCAPALCTPSGARSTFPLLPLILFSIPCMPLLHPRLPLSCHCTFPHSLSTSDPLQIQFSTHSHTPTACPSSPTFQTALCESHWLVCKIPHLDRAFVRSWYSEIPCMAIVQPRVVHICHAKIYSVILLSDPLQNVFFTVKVSNFVAKHTVKLSIH